MLQFNQLAQVILHYCWLRETRRYGRHHDVSLTESDPRRNKRSEAGCAELRDIQDQTIRKSISK